MNRPRAPRPRGARLLLVGLALLAGRPAFATAPEPGGDAPGPIPTYRARDGQAWATPTALTAPRGTVTLSLYELIFPVLGFSPHDALEVGVGGLTDFDNVYVAAGRAKLRASSSGGRLHGAAFGFFARARDRSVRGGNGNSGGGGGLVVSLCDGPEGRLVGSLFGVVTGLERENLFVGGNALVTLVGPLRLVAEVMGSAEADELMVNVLARAAFRRFAAEIGVATFTDGAAFPIGTIAVAFP
jgi:hypothetical protein